MSQDATNALQLHKILSGNTFVHGDTIIRMEELPNYPTIDSLFGKRYYKVLFMKWPDREIGHWVVLTHLEGTRLEYFDPAGQPPPDIVHNWCASVGVSLLDHSNAKLLPEDSFRCGQFVLARISSQPTDLQTFIDVLISSDKFSANDIIGFLFNVDSVW